MALLRGITPQLEQLSIDEAFLDVTDIVAAVDKVTGRSLALEIQRRVWDELELSCSLGVASNKMVAKIATDCGKATISTGQSPRALCVVEAGTEADFLAPLPVSALWGVGPKLEAKLKELGVETIGELARRDERDLAHRFGKHGVDLAKHARGIDRREVVTERETKSISSETTFLQDIGEWEPLHATLREQAQSVASQLQKQKLQASTVKLKIRWSDFSFSTRQTTLLSSTDTAPTIESAATTLLSRLWVGGEPIRLLGVGVSGLSPVRQLGLFDSIDEPEATHEEIEEPEESELDSIVDERRQRLHETLSLLEARFGSAMVHLGAHPKSVNQEN